MEEGILIAAILIVGLALFFGFTNGFHDAGNVVASIISTRALSPRRALLMASLCEFMGPFLFGSAVARTIGENIVDLTPLATTTTQQSTSLVIAALMGAIAWNLITWFYGVPSSSSHALVGGMMGAVMVAYGPDRIIWTGVGYIVLVLISSPLVGLLFGAFALRTTLSLARHATPKARFFFSRMQIFSSIILSLGTGAIDAQKSMGLITISLVFLGFVPSFQIPSWVIGSCAAAIALGTASGGWRIIKTLGMNIYRLRSVHAFCAQTSSAAVILGAALIGGPVSTTHVVSSSIMGVGAEQRISAVRWGVVRNIVIAWLVTIPASAVMAGLSFFLIQLLLPGF